MLTHSEKVFAEVATSSGQVSACEGYRRRY